MTSIEWEGVIDSLRARSFNDVMGKWLADAHKGLGSVVFRTYPRRQLYEHYLTDDHLMSPSCQNAINSVIYCIAYQ